MNQFVLIFRQGPPPMTDADRQRRFEETTAWVRNLEADHKLDPRILVPEREHRGPKEPAAGAWPVTALLFLEAHDLNEATTIAAAHPALRYGANVEVCAWATPVAVIP